MYDPSQPRGIPSTGSTLMGFTLGAVVGAGLALLLAPENGRQTRERLVSTARRLSRSAEHTVERARGTISDIGHDAKSAIKAGQDTFQHERAARLEGRMTDPGDVGLSASKRSGGDIGR